MDSFHNAGRHKGSPGRGLRRSEKPGSVVRGPRRALKGTAGSGTGRPRGEGGSPGSRGHSGAWHPLSSRELGHHPPKPELRCSWGQQALTHRSVKTLNSLNSLTLIRQEVQHGLQQEGQVSDREGGVPHPSRGVHQLVKQAHLDGRPASVRACHGSQSVITVLPNHALAASKTQA